MPSKLQRLGEWLGPDAPQFIPYTGQDPLDYIEQLLQWGAPAGASLTGCILRDSDVQLASVNVSALHAAGCFPHAWGVPLSLAGVRAANRRMAEAAAAAPAQVLSAAMIKSLHGLAIHPRTPQAVSLTAEGGRGEATWPDPAPLPELPRLKQQQQRQQQRQQRYQVWEQKQQKQQQQPLELPPEQQQQRHGAQAEDDGAGMQEGDFEEQSLGARDSSAAALRQPQAQAACAGAGATTKPGR